MSTLDKCCGLCGSYVGYFPTNGTNLCKSCSTINVKLLHVYDFKLRKYRFNGQHVDLYDIVEKESGERSIEGSIHNPDKRKLKRILRRFMYGNLSHLIK